MDYATRLTRRDALAATRTDRATAHGSRAVNPNACKLFELLLLASWSFGGLFSSFPIQGVFDLLAPKNEDGVSLILEARSEDPTNRPTAVFNPIFESEDRRPRGFFDLRTRRSNMFFSLSLALSLLSSRTKKFRRRTQPHSFENSLPSWKTLSLRRTRFFEEQTSSKHFLSSKNTAFFEDPLSSKTPFFEESPLLRRTPPSSKNTPFFEEPPSSKNPSSSKNTPSHFRSSESQIDEPPIFVLRT